VANATLTSTGGIFDIEVEGDTIIVVPAADLRALDYKRVELGAKAILELLDDAAIKNVVVDFGKTDYYGSTALGFFVKLLKRVRSRNGLMAFCNVSDHEKEILRITGLHQSWPICASRIEALEAVKQ
jgi:anti-anti-sigma factor